MLVIELAYIGINKVIQNSSGHKIGLHLQRFSWQYPIWALLNTQDNEYQIKAVNVNNPSTKYAHKDFIPCLIIDNLTDNNILSFNNKDYYLIKRFKALNIFGIN